MTKESLGEIAVKCMKGIGRHVATRGDHQVWRVITHGTSMLVVFDPERVRVVTILHPKVVLRANGSVDVRASLANGTPDYRSIVVNELRRGGR